MSKSHDSKSNLQVERRKKGTFIRTDYPNWKTVMEKFGKHQVPIPQGIFPLKCGDVAEMTV